MLVALHGFTETDLSWQEVFGPTCLEVSCPLLPGHGWAPCPPETTIASASSDIIAAYDDEQIDLLGYSLGGRLALQLALDHPDRIRRLILISSRPGIEQAEWRQLRNARDEGLAEILEEDGIGTFVAWWENQRVMRPYQALPRPVEQALRSRRLNQDPLGLAAALRCLGQGVMPPLWDRLPQLSCPVLLLSGAADPDYVAEMSRMQELIPNCSHHTISETGHAIHRERPDELLKEVIAFLTN